MEVNLIETSRKCFEKYEELANKSNIMYLFYEISDSPSIYGNQKDIEKILNYLLKYYLDNTLPGSNIDVSVGCFYNYSFVKLESNDVETPINCETFKNQGIDNLLKLYNGEIKYVKKDLNVNETIITFPINKRKLTTKEELLRMEETRIIEMINEHEITKKAVEKSEKILKETNEEIIKKKNDYKKSLEALDEFIKNLHLRIQGDIDNLERN